MIIGRDIVFSYDVDESPNNALDGVNIEVKRGEIVAILGQNGCGKSTLAKHFNALLPLQGGELTVAGINTRDESNRWELRRLCGMVFQNPDNQFVSSVVAEDIAFGLENYDFPANEIFLKIEAALCLVDMSGYEKRPIDSLSGGQKQRVALAGVLALNPEIIIFDEATSMLDPEGRREVLDIIRKLRDYAGKTIVMISHYVEEAVIADKVYLMRNGKIICSGSPRDILGNQELMRSAELLPPIPTRIYHDLKASGVSLDRCPLTCEELVEELCRLN